MRKKDAKSHGVFWKGKARRREFTDVPVTLGEMIMHNAATKWNAT